MPVSSFGGLPEGNGSDFLGFAIERTAGFDAPKPDHSDFSSKDAPIQKFTWWDARIDTKDRGTT